MKGNLVVSNRDMSVFANRVELTDGSIAITTFSVETDKIKTTKCVRANVKFMVTHFKPISDTT